MVAIKPDNMTFEEAAAVPIGANTALYILQEADIQNGHKVLIYGASGSVGSYAVQLAKYWGADVTGVCSTGNLDWVKELGANRVIDYTKSDFTQINETYDVIFDTVRKLLSSQCKGLLGENGKKKEQDGKELILELNKTPVNIQEFMNKVVEKIVQRTVVEQGVEISTVEIGPRTDRSTKFQLVPSSPINTVYSISFDDIDAGLGVFLEVVIEVSGAYKLAKKTIQKALSKRIAENTVEVINEVLKD
jgi:hypothetical protein